MLSYCTLQQQMFLSTWHWFFFFFFTGLELKIVHFYLKHNKQKKISNPILKLLSLILVYVCYSTEGIPTNRIKNADQTKYNTWLMNVCLLLSRARIRREGNEKGIPGRRVETLCSAFVARSARDVNNLCLTQSLTIIYTFNSAQQWICHLK